MHLTYKFGLVTHGQVPRDHRVGLPAVVHVEDNRDAAPGIRYTLDAPSCVDADQTDEAGGVQLGEVPV